MIIRQPIGRIFLILVSGLVAISAGCAAEDDTLPVYVNQKWQGEGLYCGVWPSEKDGEHSIRVRIANGTEGDLFIAKLRENDDGIWESCLGQSGGIVPEPETVVIDGQERRVLRMTLTGFSGLTCKMESLYLPGQGMKPPGEPVVPWPGSFHRWVSFHGTDDYWLLRSVRGALAGGGGWRACDSKYQDMPLKLPDTGNLEYTDVEITWYLHCVGPGTMRRRVATLNHKYRISHVQQAEDAAETE